ncbi:hypothetical protein HPB48_003003 [Haemaphysalis longicornis]|uniref:RRM domain-containing protein n=1 Tax=Haemaphysalis longicornis TaxID=44386 RepID=A0A9J6FE11_HAELO|nr:hypothetical protein HPB48_003003 [Haemaphysalis longicornis]
MRKSRDFGFVTFNAKDTIEAVLKATPHTVKGKQIDPKPAKALPGIKKIFVGGLESDIPEADIEAYLEAGFGGRLRDEKEKEELSLWPHPLETVCYWFPHRGPGHSRNHNLDRSRRLRSRLRSRHRRSPGCPSLGFDSLLLVNS